LSATLCLVGGAFTRVYVAGRQEARCATALFARSASSPERKSVM
jgi:hypothetical protein